MTCARAACRPAADRRLIPPSRPPRSSCRKAARNPTPRATRDLGPSCRRASLAPTSRVVAEPTAIGFNVRMRTDGDAPSGSRRPYVGAPLFRRLDRHHNRSVVGELGDILKRQVEVGCDQRGRRVGKPVRKLNVLVGVGFKDLQEHQVGAAKVLDVMTEVRRDVTDVAGVEIVRHRLRPGVKHCHLR